MPVGCGGECCRTELRPDVPPARLFSTVSAAASTRLSQICDPANRYQQHEQGFRCASDFGRGVGGIDLHHGRPSHRARIGKRSPVSEVWASTERALDEPRAVLPTSSVVAGAGAAVRIGSGIGLDSDVAGASNPGGPMFSVGGTLTLVRWG